MNATSDDAPGLLTVPQGSAALVVIADEGLGRGPDPVRQPLLKALQSHGWATLWLALPASVEAAAPGKPEDARGLACIVEDALRWAAHDTRLQSLPLGLLGAGTGVAAVLGAAALPHVAVAAVVTCGGRPDQAIPDLPKVRAPVLLLVGATRDDEIAAAKQAVSLLCGDARLQTVPGAGERFDEAGVQDVLARMAGDWLAAHLPTGGT